MRRQRRWRRHLRRHRWWGRRRQHPHQCRWRLAHPLSELEIGQQAEVIDIRSSGERRLAQLSTLGLVPGSYVRLHQRRPAYVVQVDETEVTLEAEIAQEIIVRSA